MARIEQPEVQRRLLAGYCGPFSIGLGLDPEAADHGAEHPPVVIVRVDDAAGISPPHHIELEGESLRVVVQGNYQAPRPLGSMLS